MNEDIQNNENRGSIKIDEKWKQRRKETFAVCLLQMFSIGLDFTMIYASSWSYVTDGMHLSHPDLFYGVIGGGKYLSSMCFCLLISKWFDIHRRLKLCAICINATTAVGYILYMIPISPIFTVAGTTLQGFFSILSALMNSEILRVYDADEIQGKFLMIMFAYGLGETVGAICIKLLDNVDFLVGELHIMYGNISSLVLLFVTIIKVVLSYFFVHDISSEFDISSQETQSKKRGPLEGRVSTNCLYKLEKVFGIDTIFLLLQQFYISSCGSIIAALIPLIMQTLHYENLAVDLWYVGASVSMICISLIIQKIKPSPLGVYYYGILSLLITMVSNIGLMALAYNLSNVVSCVLLSAFVICYAVFWVCGNTFIIITIGKLCHSKKKSYIESVRMVTHLSGLMVGSLVSAFIFEYFTYSFPLIITLTTFLLIGIAVRRKTLRNPKVMETNIPLV